MLRRALSLLPAVWLATCIGTGAGTSTGRQATRGQRDSAVANSSLPGAAAVGRAMDAVEAANAHAAAMDSIR